MRVLDVDEDVAATLGLREAQGALVAVVQSLSPAEAAGLKGGDAILAIDGVGIADGRDLSRQIAAFAPGTSVELKLLRGERVRTMPVTLGRQPRQR